MPTAKRLHPADRRKIVLDVKAMKEYKEYYRGQPVELVDALAEITKNGRRAVARSKFRIFLNANRKRIFETLRKVTHKDVWRIYEINRHTLMRMGVVDEIDVA